MKPWRKMLVAVQVDSSSAAVVDQAAQLALWSGAELDLVHVFETPGYDGPAELVLEEGRVSAGPLEHWRSAKAMAAMMEGLFHRGVHVGKGSMLHGVVEDRLIGLVRHHAYDVLVIGNHHPSRLERVLSGDMAGVLLNRCPCPLMVIPHD
jgi:universal stress protein A